MQNKTMSPLLSELPVADTPITVPRNLHIRQASNARTHGYISSDLPSKFPHPNPQQIPRISVPSIPESLQQIAHFSAPTFRIIFQQSLAPEPESAENVPLKGQWMA